MQHRVEKLSPIAAMIAMVPSLLFAAPPENDGFDSPVVLVGFPASARGTNEEATLEAGEPLPTQWGGAGEASVWFRWTSSTSGPVRIDTIGSGFDTLLVVWNGSALSNLTLLAENDQYDGDQSAVFIEAESGVTYQIGVYGWSDARGVITLAITNDLASRITGAVTGPGGILPLPGLDVAAYRWNELWVDWEQVGQAFTDVDGHYAIDGLPVGTYRVQFTDMAGEYLSEVYDDAPDLESGADIVVPAEAAVAGIDASLANASKIAGTVTGLGGMPPLQGIEAAAYRWNESWEGWEWAGQAYTGPDGQYTIGGLPTGTYRVQFADWADVYAQEAYDNAADLDSGADIVVPVETTVAGIDASLAMLSAPPPIVGVTRSGTNDWEMRFVGIVGVEYILQETTSPTNLWSDVGSPVLCVPGTNAIPMQSSGPVMFWRIRSSP